MRETVSGETVNGELEAGSGKPFTAPRSPLSAGFVLPAAIFLLVVLGGLASWMIQLTVATQAQDALAIEGERAYQAAQAGLEAGIYAALNGSCGSQNIAFGNSLSRFSTSVSCAESTADEGGTTRIFRRITSVACNQPMAGACPNTAPSLSEYAERHVSATVEQ